MINLFSLPGRWIKLYLLKRAIDRLLILSVTFSVCLLAARILFTGTLTSATLAWNLWLAFIPYYITQTIGRKPALIQNKWRFIPVFMVWLLFIPNSFYIITDLFHLQETRNAPLWFDLLLIFSFAWNGLLMGVLSVRQMEKAIAAVWMNKHEWLFLYPVMVMNALGIYIGRYLRYNSWDVITSPFPLMTDILHLILNPVLYKNAWGMICCYSFFITIMYLTIKRTSKMIW